MDVFLQQPYPVLASSVLAEKHKPDDDNKIINLITTIANILGIKDANSVDPKKNLVDLGMDSLMSTEIKQTLERNYKILLSAQHIGALTFAKLQELSSTSGKIMKEQQLIAANTINATNLNHLTFFGLFIPCVLYYTSSILLSFL